MVITAKGYGKRVPVSQFRLQNRAGMGLRSIKFKSKEDELVGLLVVHAGDELMLVTNRGVIIRQAVDAISTQSRGATGVRVQKLDTDDAIAAVAIVPLSEEDEGLEITEVEATEVESTEVEATEVESTEVETMAEESPGEEE
ncbi:DNA gyrase C-terminal beta-propeller domain-containing protein [Spirulina sp. 06S082]|nr:DNA gyrase C-terminal beta-propeller domain-containing protein [Spirulina sp. 06S082]MEA5470258.1 DNA gyrase C-terminal beta-propeller domain-containing protein [Spirulina sp. 06S082]